jgi:ariadne-1
MSDDEDDFVDEVEDDDKDNHGGNSDAEDPPEDFRDIYSANRQKSYQVLEMNEIIGESKKIVKETTDVLGLPSQVAAVALLRHFGWNKEKLIEKYMEDPETVCREAGMANLSRLSTQPTNPNEKVSCLVCYEELPAKETYALGCGHRYCRPCWRVYLEMRVKEGAECTITRCMKPKCKDIVHEEAVKDLVSPEAYKVYSKYLERSFIDDNPLVKWCPFPGCTNSVKCERKNRREAVVCKCGFRWCFSCCDPNIGDHMPVPCDWVEQWMTKATNESENVTWLIANTKRCPNCRAAIEKNGGCMHMTCRKNAGGCGHEFCWLCRGPWTEHGSATGGFYACNKYDKSEAKKEDDTTTGAKSELEYYMFYYHRYDSHKNAMKIADEQRKTAEKRATELQEKFEVRAADTKFLREATEQLLENRRVLRWSYVYGFYLPRGKNSERNLFEWLQEDLEKHTNQLSTLYETAYPKIDSYQAFIKWKEEVTNYTRVTAKYLANFVEGVAGGLTQQA